MASGRFGLSSCLAARSSIRQATRSAPERRRPSPAALSSVGCAYWPSWISSRHTLCHEPPPTWAKDTLPRMVPCRAADRLQLTDFGRLLLGTCQAWAAVCVSHQDGCCRWLQRSQLSSEADIRAERLGCPLWANRRPEAPKMSQCGSLHRLSDTLDTEEKRTDVMMVTE